MADKQDWKTVALVADHSNRIGSNPGVSNQVTEFARDYANGKKRTAAGVSSILDFGGPSGSSIPSILAQNSAISSLLYTMSRADKLQLFRYFNRHDPMVGRAIDLHTELPMSRVTIGPPKGPSPRQNKEITRIYESMCDDIDLMSLLLDIPRELWIIGDVYLWVHWDAELLTIDEAYVLPAEYMHSIIHPFNRKKEIVFFAKPLVDTAAIRRITDRDLYLVADTDIERLYESLGDSIPEELKEALNYGEAVPLNTNWRRGSFCVHIARDRPPNEEYGISLIERNMDTLLRLENLKNANFQISSRNMAPKYIISAPGIGKDALAELRTQFDLSLLETADYPVVTNYEVNVQTLGANDRLLNTESEYTILRQDLAMGLGSTVDMLTGASTYGGQRITLETMNTQYLRLRDNMKTFVEKSLFLPVAFAKGHYMEEEIEMWPRVKPEDTEVGDILIEERNGHLRRKRTQINTIWMYSTLRFNRVSIRDNAEVYDQLFQLYQKGSLAVRYLLDLHNIDPEENAQALLEDLGTPKDSVFNDFSRALYTSTDVPQKVVNSTDFIDRIIKGMKLQYKPQGAGAGGAGGGGGGMGGGMSDMGGLGGGGGGMGGMPGGMPGGPEGAMPGAEAGGAPGMPGAPGAPGATGAAPGPEAPPPTASRRRASRQAAEALPDPLPGRVLDLEVSEKLRGVVTAKYNAGIDLSPRDIKREIHKIESEKQRALPTPNGSNGVGHRRGSRGK